MVYVQRGRVLARQKAWSGGRLMEESVRQELLSDQGGNNDDELADGFVPGDRLRGRPS